MNAHALFFSRCVFFVDYLIDFYLNLCIFLVNGHCPYAIELECDALKSNHMNYMNTFFGNYSMSFNCVCLRKSFRKCDRDVELPVLYIHYMVEASSIRTFPINWAHWILDVAMKAHQLCDIT